ncbi:HNH endonuclease [Corynebacterium callunae]|uniref:HNH endonuclease signature motif containing protein n=1 Tax=Corynebacterium callunae TaxID=1721 RepID=UPI003981F244
MAYFSHQDPGHPESKINFQLAQMEIQRWSILIDDPSVDASSLVMELKSITGESRRFIAQAIDAIWALNSLPILRIVVETHFHIRIPYLARIMQAVKQAGEDLWPELDRRIAEKLSPRVPGQILMEASALAGLITKWIKELDPNFTGKKKGLSGEERSLIFRHSEGRTYFSGDFDGVSGQRFQKALEALKIKGGSLADAFMDFLEQKTAVKVVQHLFTPLVGGVSWLPGAGFLSQEESRKLGEMKSRTIDMDAVALRVENGYTPSPLLKLYVMARDGTCRHPGCTVSAQNCQIDHVIPFGEGGLTVMWNLQCLCSHHHNMKTDKRVKAAIDVMGRVTWIGPANRPVVTEPSGPLAQEMPTGQWGQTLAARMEASLKRLRNSLERKDG